MMLQELPEEAYLKYTMELSGELERSLYSNQYEDNLNTEFLGYFEVFVQDNLTYTIEIDNKKYLALRTGVHTSTRTYFLYDGHIQSRLVDDDTEKDIRAGRIPQ